MRWKLLAAVLLIVVGVGAVVFVIIGPAAGAGSDTKYLTATATRTDVAQQAVATGSVSASATYALSFGSAPQLAASDSSASNGSGGSGATWNVKSVKVKPGDTVKKGQVLATVDTTDLRRQYNAADASYNAARYQMLIAQDQVDNATTTDALRQARISLYNAQSQQAQAAKTRADLKTQLDHAQLVAPTAGIVTAVNVVAGLPFSGSAAIQLDALPLTVTASFSETDLPTLKVGQAATVTITALDRSLTGTVTGITPAATSSGTSSVVTYSVTVSLQNAPADLRSGMSADVSVTTASAANVIAVPAIALNGAKGDYSVRVLNADGTVSTRVVQVGLVTSSLAEIRSGIDTGEEVVTGTSNARQNSQSGNFGGFGGGGFTRQGGGQNQGPQNKIVVPAP